MLLVIEKGPQGEAIYEVFVRALHDRLSPEFDVEALAIPALSERTDQWYEKLDDQIRVNTTYTNRGKALIISVPNDIGNDPDFQFSMRYWFQNRGVSPIVVIRDLNSATEFSHRSEVQRIGMNANMHVFIQEPPVGPPKIARVRFSREEPMRYSMRWMPARSRCVICAAVCRRRIGFPGFNDGSPNSVGSLILTQHRQLSPRFRTWGCSESRNSMRCS